MTGFLVPKKLNFSFKSVLIFCDISETTGFSVPLRYVISQVGISQHIYPNTIYPNTIYPKPFDSSRVVSFAPLIPHLTKETRLVARLVSKANPFISPRDAPSQKHSLNQETRLLLPSNLTAGIFPACCSSSIEEEDCNEEHNMTMNEVLPLACRFNNGRKFQLAFAITIIIISATYNDHPYHRNTYIWL